MDDYFTWGTSELIERIQELEGNMRDMEKKCAYCGECMYTTIRAHHHAESGKDVTRMGTCAMCDKPMKPRADGGNVHETCGGNLPF